MKLELNGRGNSVNSFLTDIFLTICLIKRITNASQAIKDDNV